MQAFKFNLKTEPNNQMYKLCALLVYLLVVDHKLNLNKIDYDFNT